MEVFSAAASIATYFSPIPHEVSDALQIVLSHPIAAERNERKSWTTTQARHWVRITEHIADGLTAMPMYVSNKLQFSLKYLWMHREKKGFLMFKLISSEQIVLSCTKTWTYLLWAESLDLLLGWNKAQSLPEDGADVPNQRLDRDKDTNYKSVWTFAFQLSGCIFKTL